jgi:hypothetical protein
MGLSRNWRDCSNRTANRATIWRDSENRATIAPSFFESRQLPMPYAKELQKIILQSPSGLTLAEVLVLCPQLARRTAPRLLS